MWYISRLLNTNLSAEAQRTQRAAEKSSATHMSLGVRGYPSWWLEKVSCFLCVLCASALGLRSNVLVLLPSIRIPVIQRPCRGHALEFARVVRKAGPLQQPAQAYAIVRTERLFACVGPEGFDAAAYIDHRFVQRIAERIARISAYDQRSCLRHERGEIADPSAHDDFDA